MTTELLYSAAINNFNESFSVIQNFGLGMVVSCILGYFISIIYKYKNSYSKEYFVFDIVIKGISALNTSNVEESKVIRSDLRTFLSHVSKISIYDEKNVQNALFTIGEKIIKRYKLW